MKYIEKLYDNVEASNKNYRLYKMKNKIITIRITSEQFTSLSLNQILSELKAIRNKYFYMSHKVDIIIEFGKIEFVDKITYLILEMIIYHLFKTTKFSIYFDIHFDNKKIVHNGLLNNSLIKSLESDGHVNKETLVREFIKNQDSSGHYRRIITREFIEKNLNISSMIGSDVFSLLRTNFGDCEFVDDIAEAVSELVDNGASHSKGDIMIDIDICDIVKSQCENNYLIVNIALINLDERLLYDCIKENIELEKYSKDDKLYAKIYDAFENHKGFFDQNYTKNHYFMITAFQNHVTSRDLISGSNGTGLTKLIEQIIETTEDNYSYVLSGDKIIFFIKDCLKIKNDFIGFNPMSDYQFSKPSQHSIHESAMYVPGTVFNLQLIKEVNI